MNIVKIAVVGLIAVILALKLKGLNPEYSVYISLVACLFIIFYALTQLTILVGFIEKMSTYIGVDSVYIKVLLKLIGIAYVCEFSSSLCKDTGYGAIASQIEIVGKLSILVVSMPIILALLDTLTSFLG